MTCHDCSVSVGNFRKKRRWGHSLSVSPKRSQFFGHLSLWNTHIDRNAKFQSVFVVLTFPAGNIRHQQQFYDGKTQASSTMSFAVFVLWPLGHKQTASWCGLSSGTKRRRKLCTLNQNQSTLSSFSMSERLRVSVLLVCMLGSSPGNHLSALISEESQYDGFVVDARCIYVKPAVGSCGCRN